MNQTNKTHTLLGVYLLLVVDMASIVVSYIIAYYLRYGDTEVFTYNAHKIVLMCLIVACILYNFVLNWNQSFIARGYFVELIAVTKYNLILLLLTAVLVFLFRQGEFYSRLVFGFFAVANELIVYILHVVCKKILRNYLKSDYSKVRVLVISEWNSLETAIERLRKTLPINYEIASLVVWDKRLSGSTQYGISVVADKESLTEVITGLPVDEVFINLPMENISTLRELIKSVETMGAICHYSIDIADWNSKESTLQQFGDYTVISYAINRQDYRRLFIKRIIDIIGAIVGLLITAVLTPFIALAIKMDSRGPVLFAQTRIGLNGRRFKLYKFRSMYVDAEERKKELMQANEMQGLMFKMENDPRITRVGRFLRRTSLDELPQFYNILIGDMSLVGTRPPTVDEFEGYSLYYRRRLCMTPGLTGMWQVSGRSNITDFNEVVKLDLQYIDNWSLTLDMKILLQTVGVVFVGKGSR